MSDGSNASAWTLSAYDHERTPHFPCSDPGVMKLSWNTLSENMKCPICLSILSETMTTMECMHRFCADCITTALRSGKKECPTCRAVCPSRRSLRRDEEFDNLVAQVYPDRGIFETHQIELMAKISQYNNAQALVESVQDGMKAQMKAKAPNRKSSRGVESTVPPVKEDPWKKEVESGAPSTKRLRRTVADPLAEEGATSKQAIKHEAEVSEFIEVILEPHPEEKGLPDLEHKFIITTGGCTVAHLAKYVATVNASAGGAHDSERERERAAEMNFLHYQLAYYSHNSNKGFVVASFPCCMTELLDSRQGEDLKHPFKLFYSFLSKAHK